MQELPLPLTSNNDPALVELDDKQRRTVEQKMQDLLLCVSQLRSGIRDNTLDKGYAETLLSNLGHYLTELEVPFGYESARKREQDERLQSLRAAHDQNRELRKQLGEKVSNEDVRERLKLMGDGLSQWATSLGFSHVSECSVGTSTFSSAATVKLSLTQFTGGLFADDQHEANGRQILEQLGLTFLPSKDRGRNPYLEDYDHNRRRLQELIKQQFPRSRVTEFSSYCYEDEPPYRRRLSELSFYIFNLDDIPVSHA